MLIFKNNIHDLKEPGIAEFIGYPDADYDARFDTGHFIAAARNEEREVFSFIEKQPSQFWDEHVGKFFPNACNIGSLIQSRQPGRTIERLARTCGKAIIVLIVRKKLLFQYGISYG